MAEGSNSAERDPLFHQRRRLRRIGGVALAIGLCGAAARWWIQPAGAADPLTAEYAESQARAQARQMGILYGKSGQVFQDLSDDLKQPRTQAISILVISAGFALTCFYLGRPAGGDGGSSDLT